MIKSKVKLISSILAVIMTLGVLGCGKTPSDKPVDTSKIKEVKIKFLTNLPNRVSGQGKLEQLLIDNYMKENKDVNIEVEALQDEPYKQKFKAYAASNQLPDIYMVWGQASFFGPVMQAGYAAELNPNDYLDYGFLYGSLNGFTFNGKLYGLPRNTDYMVLYYNKGLFEKNNVKVPTNIHELIDTAKAFRAKGIAPCAINGKDKWSISLLYQDLVIKEGGDQKLIYNAISGKSKFVGNPVLTKAANDLKELMDADFFQDSFTSADYGTANNLFAKEKAAMYYMGSWELGMESNEEFSDSFKKNIDVVRFPVAKDGRGKATDLVAWNGGGYAVSAKSKVKADAIKFLNYMMKADNWPQMGWQQGLVVPAQEYDSFFTGKETILQKKLTEILRSSTSISGTSWNDSITPDFKTSIEDLSQQLAAAIITPDKFLEEVDRAVEKSSGKQFPN